jgi:hypothetical protein
MASCVTIWSHQLAFLVWSDILKEEAPISPILTSRVPLAFALTAVVGVGVAVAAGAALAAGAGAAAGVASSPQATIAAKRTAINPKIIALGLAKLNNGVLPILMTFHQGHLNHAPSRR